MPRPEAAGEGAGYALPLVLIVAVIAAVALTFGGGGFSVDRSAIGFDGLVAWLSKGGTEARTFRGGDHLTSDRVGLRVYPLYDVDLGAQDSTATGRLHAFNHGVVEVGVVKAKLASLPTLMVLPKWRSEMVGLGVVHRYPRRNVA